MTIEYKGYRIDANAQEIVMEDNPPSRWIAMPSTVSRLVGGRLRKTPSPEVDGLFASKDDAESAIVESARQFIDLGDIDF